MFRYYQKSAPPTGREGPLSGRPDAVSWFPEGSYLPAMVFVGDPAPAPPAGPSFPFPEVEPT